MPLPDDLLNPIEGPNPSGTNLRYDSLYDKIKEARREEALPPPGMAEQDRKVADNVLVIKLGTEALATKTKDLQLAAWLTEALLKKEGFGGLRDGLAVCHGLVEKFWDTLYPEPEDGDMSLRGTPLDFIGTALAGPLRAVPLVGKAPYGLTDWQQAREVVKYEGDAKSDDAKKARAAALAEGKIAPELFDKCFEETPKAFYAGAEKSLDGCLGLLGQIKALCDSRFPDADSRPSLARLQAGLEEVRRVVHGFLQKKREKEPDPVEEAPAGAEGSGAEAAGGAAAATAPARTGLFISLETSSEPPDRVDAIRKIAEAATLLRAREPYSPAAYLLLRGLRWGELRAATSQQDPTRLEAPPTELRRHLKQLALDKKWNDLLEAAERAMALPCSRAWLDLQRYVVEACEALGSDYDAIAAAIRSELRALVADVPPLLDALLMDDTPAANGETKAWLKSLAEGTVAQAAGGEAPPVASTSANGAAPRWPARPAEGYEIARRLFQEGQKTQALEILQQDIMRQRSGRERFRRKLQLVEMCISAQKPNIAQPILDDLAAAIEAHKLDDWEDPAMVAGALAAIMKLSQRIQNDQGQKQKLFERICRLDPAKALGETT